MPNIKYKTARDAEILGVALVSIADNLRIEQFADLVEEYGFYDIDPEKWYSFQWELDFMKALSQRMESTEYMVAIGIRIFDKLVLPPEIHTIEDGIKMLNEIVHINMRNLPPESDYAIADVDEKHIRVTDRTSFPHNLVYGYLHGLCKKMLPPGNHFIIQREYLNADNPDSSGAIYDISWE